MNDTNLYAPLIFQSHHSGIVAEQTD